MGGNCVFSCLLRSPINDRVMSLMLNGVAVYQNSEKYNKKVDSEKEEGKKRFQWIS